MKRSDLNVGDEVAVGKADYRRNRAVILSLKPEPILRYQRTWDREASVGIPWDVEQAAHQYVTVAVCTGGNPLEWRPTHVTLTSIQHSWAQEEVNAAARQEADERAQEAARSAEDGWREYLDRIAGRASQAGIDVEQVRPEEDEYGWVDEWNRGWKIDGTHYSYRRPVLRIELRRETFEALLTDSLSLNVGTSAFDKAQA